MRAQRQPALLAACALSALVLSACSSGSSEPASSAAATSAAAVETSGDYLVGDTGPGGGIVFYDAGSVQPWGRYLEAGPQLAPTDWCGDDWELDVAGTKETIGAGAANTELIAAACGEGGGGCRYLASGLGLDARPRCHDLVGSLRRAMEQLSLLGRRTDLANDPPHPRRRSNAA